MFFNGRSFCDFLLAFLNNKTLQKERQLLKEKFFPLRADDSQLAERQERKIQELLPIYFDTEIIEKGSESKKLKKKAAGEMNKQDNNIKSFNILLKLTPSPIPSPGVMQ